MNAPKLLNLSFFFTLVIIFLGCPSSDDDTDPMTPPDCTVDWTGSYTGVDIFTKINENDTIEETVTVELAIETFEDNDSDDNLKIVIKLFFEVNTPEIYELQGVASCENNFIVRSDIFPSKQDLNGQYLIEFPQDGTGRWHNTSNDIIIEISETKTYLPPSNPNQINYEATHEIIVNPI